MIGFRFIQDDISRFIEKNILQKAKDQARSEVATHGMLFIDAIEEVIGEDAVVPILLHVMAHVHGIDGTYAEDHLAESLTVREKFEATMEHMGFEQGFNNNSVPAYLVRYYKETAEHPQNF